MLACVHLMQSIALNAHMHVWKDEEENLFTEHAD